MISDNKRRLLESRMNELGISEIDLEEHFIRSGGHGGQNVNKTNTCVYLKHTPTGIEVKCQITRSQADNRFLARRILCDKIEALKKGKESAAARERHRIRKQKKKRSKRAKEKVLEDKRVRAEKKMGRKKISDSDH